MKPENPSSAVPFWSILSVLAVLTILTILAMPLAAAAQEPAADPTTEKEALAREMLEVTGSGEIGVQVMEQMRDALRPTAPDLPDEFWDRVFSEVDAGELVELVVPIYVEHLTEDEMRAAIAFYRTPEGRSLVGKLPAITQESFAVGQQWGMEIAQQVMEEISAAREEAEDGEDGGDGRH